MKRYRLEIVDVSEIPREYLIPNEPLIIAEMKKNVRIRGCVLHEEEKTEASGR